MPPFIQFPNIPEYPGVPQLVRPVERAIARVPALATTIGSLSNVLAQAIQQGSKWGVYAQDGTQLGMKDISRTRFVDFVNLQLSGDKGANSTTIRWDYRKEAQTSDYQTEGGSFASFNKVSLAMEPVITLCLEGSESDRAYFLTAIEAACDSTDLYNIVTPEKTYSNYTIENLTNVRTAQQGAGLLIMDVQLREIRQVNASYAQATIIIAPQNPAATPQTDNGKVQATKPDTSTLKSLANKFGSIFGGN